MNSRWFRSLLVGSTVALAACGDEPVGPATLPSDGAHFSSGTSRGLPSPTSNRIKYQETGHRPATGRENSASLTMRALLGSDNTVDLAITTGTAADLDRATGPGSLEKVQLKIFDVDGNPISTSNYNKLNNGGFASYALADLLRGSRIQVQAHVRATDSKRTELVTVSDLVKLRPDLKVRDLMTPTLAVPNAPVSLGATVLEVNGDVGARADCVLSVDGTEVDRARGIWVDAGSSVSCVFSHIFRSVGTRTLKVAVVGVAPGDFDTANNEVTGSITVAQPNTNDFSTVGSAEDIVLSHFYTSRSNWSWSTDDSLTFHHGTSEYSSSTDGRAQRASQSGTMNRELSFPLSVEVRHASNGNEIVNQTFADILADAAYGGFDWRSACARRAFSTPAAGNVWLEVCSGAWSWSGGEEGHTRIEQYRWAGEVTYFGRDFYQTWYGDTQCVDGCWADNWDYTQSAGMPLPTLGSDYTLQAVLTKNAVRWTASVTVPLQPVSTSQRFPASGESCYSWDHGASYQHYRGTDCSVSGSSERGVRGSARNEPAQ